MPKPKLIDTNLDAFDRIKDWGNLNPDVVYCINHPNGDEEYAVSPDGQGAYYYDSYEEAQEDNFPE